MANTAASQTTDPVSGLSWVDLAALPKQASDTMRVIKAGPPFSAYKDGATFGNNERLLPIRPGGYYHEFTVVTPGSSDRGARRGGTYALWRPAKALLKDATAAKWHRVAHLEGALVIGKAEVLAAIGRCLRFPAHYGKNLDALADCLGDLPQSTVLIWSGWQAVRLELAGRLRADRRCPR